MTETTTRLEPTTLRDVLQVYTIHQTGEDIATETSNDTRDFVSQPDWPSDRRRIPPYRSTTRTYPLSERPGGVTTFEGVIVVVMFSGVYTVAVVNKLWRGSVGRLNNNIMRYPIGGEW